MTVHSLFDYVACRPNSFLNLPPDDAIITGDTTPPGDVVTAPAGWCAADIEKNSVTIAVSREYLLDMGLIEPTSQEAADRAAQRAAYRIRAARQEQVRAEWFSAVLDAAGPVGRAILEEHVPGEYDDCEGDGFDSYAGLSWPCRTLRTGAAAAGIPVPEEIW